MACYRDSFTFYLFTLITYVSGSAIPNFHKNQYQNGQSINLPKLD
jgi:hypothetical protein